MTLNAALFFSLVAFFPFSTHSACRNLTKCPCGRTGENFWICMGESKLEDACSRWSACKSCRDGLKTCWECPEGFEGPYCERATQDGGLPRLKRQISRRRRPTTRRKPAAAVDPRYVYRGDNNGVFCDNPGSISLGRTMLDVTSVPDRTTMDDQELPLGSRLLFSCNTGYSLEGAASVTCEEQGFWSADPPICKRSSNSFSLTCSDPAPIPNGRVQPVVAGSRPATSGYPTGSRLEYSCEEGYTLIGSQTMSCQTSGFWSGTRPSCQTDCGHTFRTTDSRVYNGTKTKVGDWPWVVAIKSGRRVICAGALIDPTTVLTAAHCLTRSDSYTLYFGKLYLSDSEDDEEVKTRISTRIFLHPHFNTNFSTSNFDSDVGLIVFKPRVQFTKRIQPICLPSSDTTIDNLVFGRKGNVAGWGLNERNLQSDLLMLANIAIRTNRECMETYTRLVGRPVELTLNQYCAGNDDDQQSLCESDSGSPMVFYDQRTDRYIVEGLVSFRIGPCGQEGRYTVFTNVYQFVPWIRCTMTERECPVV